MKVWTEPEMARIRAEFPTALDVQELAESMGVTPSSLRSKADNMGVKRDPAAKFAANSAASLRGDAPKWDINSTVAKAVASRSALEVAWGG